MHFLKGIHPVSFRLSSSSIKHKNIYPFLTRIYFDHRFEICVPGICIHQYSVEPDHEQKV